MCYHLRLKAISDSVPCSATSYSKAPSGFSPVGVFLIGEEPALPAGLRAMPHRNNREVHAYSFNPRIPEEARTASGSRNCRRDRDLLEERARLPRRPDGTWRDFPLQRDPVQRRPAG